MRYKRFIDKDGRESYYDVRDNIYYPHCSGCGCILFLIVLVVLLLGIKKFVLDGKYEFDKEQSSITNDSLNIGRPCSVNVSDEITIDSMGRDDENNIITTYLTVSGTLDSHEAMQRKKAELRDSILSADSEFQKETGMTHQYVYYSTKNHGQVLLELTLTAEDFN